MLLKEEKVNLGRQKEFDVIKTLAIFFMVTIHVYEELSQADIDLPCSGLLDTIIQFLGGPLAAPVFMFALGLGLSYSSHRTPKDLMKRGLHLLVISYLFNMVRFTTPYLLVTKLKGIGSAYFFFSIFHVDILTFAGASFLLTGLLKKLNVSVYGVLIIAILMQAFGFIITNNIEFPSNLSIYFYSIFVKASYVSYFPLSQWYIYPALGLFFAKYLRHIENKDELYFKLLCISSVLLFGYSIALVYMGIDIRTMYQLADDVFYDQTLIHTIFSLLCVLFELSIVHFILKWIKLPRLESVIAFMSKQLNLIYIVQWIIVGWTVIIFRLEIPVIYVIPLGIVITIIASLLVYFYQKVKKANNKDC